MASIPPHERLRVWHSTLPLVKAVYETSATWPSDEKYGLVRQVRRAVVSILLNLAEGNARTGMRQMRSFAQIAYGSAREVEAIMTVSKVLEMSTKEQRDRVKESLDPVLRQLLRLIQSLDEDRRPPSSQSPSVHPSIRPSVKT